VLLRITLIGLSLLIVACSGPTRKPNEQAIFHALVEDVTFRKLSEHCRGVSKIAANKVWRAQKKWWERNGVFIEAADYNFSYNLINLTGERQETGARYAMGLSYDIVYEAESRANETITNGLEEEACIEVMSDYSDGKMDLSENKDFYALLLNLVQQKKDQGDDLQLKQSRLEVQKGQTYSRSSITARNIARRTVCPGVVIQTLKSKWPLEIFEAVCPDESYALLECKWGHCKTL